jgi:hypothetical protein
MLPKCNAGGRTSNGAGMQRVMRGDLRRTHDPLTYCQPFRNRKACRERRGKTLPDSIKIQINNSYENWYRNTDYTGWTRRH